MTSAQLNYQLALEELRVDELMKKEDDLPWVVSLALDLLGAHLLAVCTSQFGRLRKDGLAAIDEEFLRAELVAGPVSKFARAGDAILNSVTPKRFEAVVKSVLDGGKTLAKPWLKKELSAHAQQRKAAHLSFLDRLKNQAGKGFQAIREQLPGMLNDAELIVAFEAADADYHTPDAYKTSFSDKLQRFDEAGIANIGRTYARHEEGANESMPGIQVDAVRDTRVVWVKYRSGLPRRLFMQFQDGARDPAVVPHGAPGTEFMHEPQTEFGPTAPFVPLPSLSRRVPDEFVETAIERHRATWNTEVETIEVDDFWAPGAQHKMTAKPQPRSTSPLPAPPKPQVQASRSDPEPDAVVVPDALVLRDQ